MATVPYDVSELTFQGNGVQTDFVVPFPILATSDLVVTVSTGGTPAVLKVEGVDYTVDAAPSDSPTVTFAVAPSGYVHVERTVPILQEVNLVTQGAFSPSTHTEMHDRRTMVEQQLARRIARLEALASLASIATFAAQLIDVTFTANAADVETTFAGGVLTAPVVVAAGELVTGVVVAKVDVVGAEPLEAVQVLDWDYTALTSTTGTLTLNYVTGLQPGKTYTLSLLLLSL